MLDLQYKKCPSKSHAPEVWHSCIAGTPAFLNFFVCTICLLYQRMDALVSVEGQENDS
jgi:hypothetical protein